MRQKEASLENPPGEINECLKNQKWLIIMVGIPGSGKTTFSEPLSQALGAYRLNLDLIRKDLFGTANRRSQKEYNRMRTINLSREEERLYHKEKAQKVKQVFWQKLEMHLDAGRSVVVDSSSDRRKQRDALRQTAEQFGALPIVVWVQTPYALSIERATYRKLASDSYPFKEEYLAREEIDRCLNTLDHPSDEEQLALINGQDSLDKQLASFTLCAVRQLS